jgi:glycerol-3-phosphate dehydrogenase
MVGGKWTTFRAFSEVVTDMTLDYLCKNRKVDTKTLPIGGGKDYPKTIQVKEKIISQVMEETGLPKERLNRLLDRYGTWFGEFASFMAREEDAPLNTSREYSLRELTFIVEHEDVVHLDDLVLRRTLLAKLGHLTADMLIELAEIVGEVLGWSPDMKKLEIVKTVEILKMKHGVSFIKV